jgi:hypothetical protein
MLRYHKNVYFNEKDIDKLANITQGLNSKTWKFSPHSLDGLKYRMIDLENVLRYIKDIILCYESIFEYYANENGAIEKICYRINYKNGVDIILVLTPDKTVVTIYINTSNDNHETLKKYLYIQPLTR